MIFFCWYILLALFIWQFKADKTHPDWVDRNLLYEEGLPLEYETDFYSGFLDILQTSKKLHYMFFESQGDPKNNPLMLWLNGGPGCSSLIGMLYDNGPFVYGHQASKLSVNKYSWNQLTNIIYLESPAGVGFSYGEENELFTNDSLSAEDNLQAMLSFFEKFPEYSQREFYIAGESYAGVYIPYLAYYILQYNKKHKDSPFNLKGIIVGSGVTSIPDDGRSRRTAAFVDYLWYRGFQGMQERENIIKYCDILNQTEQCQKHVLHSVYTLTNQVNLYNTLKPCYLDPKTFQRKGLLPCLDAGQSIKWFNNKNVREALHIDDKIQKWMPCYIVKGFIYDRKKTVGSFKFYPKLFEAGLKIIKYSGDVDAFVNILGTMRWIQKFKNTGKIHLKNKMRKIYTSDQPKQVAGFITEYNEITFISIKGAGHMAPRDQPKVVLRMLDKLLNDKDI